MHSPYPCDGLVKKPYGTFSCSEYAKWQIGEGGLRACGIHLNQICDIPQRDEITLKRLRHD